MHLFIALVIAADVFAFTALKLREGFFGGFRHDLVIK